MLFPRNAPNYSSNYIEENITFCALGDSVVEKIVGFLDQRNQQRGAAPQVAVAAPAVGQGQAAPAPAAAVAAGGGGAAAVAGIQGPASVIIGRRSGRKRSVDQAELEKDSEKVSIGSGMKVYKKTRRNLSLIHI